MKKNKIEDLVDSKKIKHTVQLILKRVFVVSGNAYSWYLLYVGLCIESKPYDFWIEWFFLTCGFYWFILENNDIFFKNNK